MAFLVTLWMSVGLFAADLDRSGTRGPEFKVDPSGRHLLLNEQPYFWLADTVWLLAQMPSRDELERYLTTRKEQGFTVIQLTAVMGEERVWGTARPNGHGDKPFLNDNPATPAVTPGNDPKDPAQYDYWDHLDYVLDRVHAHGFRAAVVTLFVGWRGEGYKYLRPDNGLEYGRFLGERYRGKPQIIWLLGGDNTPDTPEKKEVWNRVARGLTVGNCGREDYAQTMLSYHINGGTSSSEHWSGVSWLDFNMAQTWSAYTEIYPRLQKDYQQTPAKPCGLGEGAYEDGPQYPTKPINALVIRKQAYWSYFAGGYHTYGNGNVWHFDSLKSELTQPWKQALNSPGAQDMAILRRFFTTVNWANCVPDQALFRTAQTGGTNLNCAMRKPDRSAFVFYLTDSKPIRIAPGLAPGASALAGRWWNPSTGEEVSAGTFNEQEITVKVPAGWGDALLHLERSPTAATR